ncbi:DUF2281 domain-containing protein [cf. Phormidesmis sp. LEGE 11477]|uniref:DUF2281 domain-containing protein n=1 Tax=cf. Phormidesmis sp. LEGE 11477 TaxID=1828680 RepID=UPI00187EB03B|nr:DUF2281 domain-containing protein [cf. Phormidesmis sp. LEGE 11477]MBE9059938.1 DUF2281 domain-containing protein [cf. Phormidesmis sp. LEGE 11477]
MSQFQLFDSVKLREKIPLEEGGTAPEGCAGSIVEVFNSGEAYMVELFGGWVSDTADGDFAESTREAPGSFMETIGVETLAPSQLRLVTPAREAVGVRAQLLALVDELPENTLEEVRDFAEFLKQKHSKAKAS